MLTKTDFQQIGKTVRKIVREEVEAESQNLKEELQGDIKMAQIRIMSEVSEVKDRLKNLEIKVSKIQRDLKTATDFLDRQELEITKKVQRIEEHLKLPVIS